MLIITILNFIDVLVFRPRGLPKDKIYVTVNIFIEWHDIRTNSSVADTECLCNEFGLSIFMMQRVGEMLRVLHRPLTERIKHHCRLFIIACYISHECSMLCATFHGMLHLTHDAQCIAPGEWESTTIDFDTSQHSAICWQIDQSQRKKVNFPI